MKGYLAFVQKEWLEATRNFKLFLMLIIFFILGIENPLVAKLTPFIMENFLPEGMSITLPEVSALDSWVQFYKNVPQMGLIVLVIIFGGMFANEFQRGTLVLMVTKGLSRNSILLAKYTVSSFIFTISYLLCVVVSWLYTAYFWSLEGLTHITFSLLLLWLFGLLLLAVVMFGSVLFKTMSGSLLVTAGFVLMLFLLNLSKEVANYNPLRLAGENLKLIQGITVPSDYTQVIIVTLILIVGFLMLACRILKKKEL